jgi:hypothetical protein
MQRRLSVLGATIALLFLAAAPASAERAAISADASDDDGPDRPITVGLLAGYGLDLGGTGELNPFGIGFGVRGGYNLDALYLGARFMFFLGDSEEITVGTTTIETSANLMTIGAEVGYDLELSDRGITLRPEVTAGLAILGGEGSDGVGGMIDTSSNNFYVAPGASLLACLGTNVFTGVDVQVPIVFAEKTFTGITFLAILGLRF